MREEESCPAKAYDKHYSILRFPSDESFSLKMSDIRNENGITSILMQNS